MKQVVINDVLAYEKYAKIKERASTTPAATFFAAGPKLSSFTSVKMISPNQLWGYSLDSDASFFCNSGRYTKAIESEKQEGGTSAKMNFWHDSVKVTINFFMEANLRAAMLVTESVEQMMCVKKAAADYM